MRRREDTEGLRALNSSPHKWPNAHSARQRRSILMKEHIEHAVARLSCQESILFSAGSCNYAAVATSGCFHWVVISTG
eukprot:6119532-Pleurochrysis_carterae.AAC.1